MLQPLNPPRDLFVFGVTVGIRLLMCRECLPFSVIADVVQRDLRFLARDTPPL